MAIQKRRLEGRGAECRRVQGINIVSSVEFELAQMIDRGFDKLYGLELTETGDGIVCGRVQVRDELKQPAGLVHGGVYAAMAESLASTGTWVAVAEAGDMAMGISNQTNFLRPISHGTINARAVARHRGRSTWVWEVELSDDADRLCVLSRVTVAVRPAPPGAPAPCF